MAASVSRTLASDDYFKVAVTLAEAGYFYTTVECGTFMYALRQSGWVVTPTLRVLIDLLARPQNDPFGVLAVLSELIHVAWAAKVEECQYEEFFTSIFAGFRNAQPQTDIVELVRTALNRVESLVYGEIFHAQFAEELKNSTNLTPVAAVTAKIDAIRNRIGTPITRVLSSALRRASARQFGYNA